MGKRPISKSREEVLEYKTRLDMLEQEFRDIKASYLSLCKERQLIEKSVEHDVDRYLEKLLESGRVESVIWAKIANTAICFEETCREKAQGICDEIYRKFIKRSAFMKKKPKKPKC